MELKYYSESGLELEYGTPHAAGLDLPYWDPKNKSCTINPGERAKLPTGVYVEIPEGHWGMVDTRSSTSKLSLDLACRTIDCDYRGQLFLVLINCGNEPVTVQSGDHLCQLIIQEYKKVKPSKQDSRDGLSKTGRGDNAFGHTGKATHNK